VLHTGAALQAMGSRDSLFSYGCVWANLSNTPLRLYKHYAHEGGIRTPLIAHWPARISKGGQLRPHLSHLMDVMATCVDVAGATYPKHLGERAILPLEGRSLLPAFDNAAEQPRTLLFEHEHNAALREGNWKLVGIDALGKEGIKPRTKWELYDLANDPFELKDLSAEQPQRVEAMARRLLDEARRTMVLPMP
jgi:arylsulfatase